jgi:outer membrane protein TolC
VAEGFTMPVIIVLIFVILLLVGSPAAGQTIGSQVTGSQLPRLITLREAVELALQRNHVVRLAGLEVEEHEHMKDVAKSAYFPSVRNDANVTHVSDTQLIEIPAGGLATVGSNLIPPQTLILNQGGQTFTSDGIGVVQPLTQLLKINAANDVARASVAAARGKARSTQNDIALQVHRLYYRILIAEAQHRAVLAKIEASDALQTERVQQVKFGSVLEADLIESRAQSLQAKQELLSNDLQLSDLHMQFNDAIGLPLGTAVTLDPAVTEAPEGCARETCISVALESHPELAEALATVDKAEAAVRLAQYDFVPDVGAFARYSFQNNMPFFAPRFATVGIQFTYELFDGGRRRSNVAAQRAQLAQAKENLARLRDEVELRVSTAYNKLERTRQMVAVSQELVTLRVDSRRVASEQLTRGATLRSQAATSLAQELEARALLLQSRLDYVQAAAELDQATGRTPR